MSRSYKKNPIYTDRNDGAKYWKRQANRRVRHYKGELQYNKYKRIYNSWEIHDWVSRWSSDEALKSYQTDVFWWRGEPEKRWNYKSEEDFMNRQWAKYYRRK